MKPAGPRGRDTRRAHGASPTASPNCDDDRRVRSQRTPPCVARATARPTPAASRNRRARSDDRHRAVWLGPGLQKSGLIWSGDDQSVIFVGRTAADAARTDIYSVRQGSAPVVLTDQPGFKSAPVVDARGATLVYTVAAASPFAARGGGAGGGAGGGGGGGGGGRAGGARHDVRHRVARRQDHADRHGHRADDVRPTARHVAWITRDADAYTLNAAPASHRATAVIAGPRTPRRAGAFARRQHVAYQMMTHTDWEIYIVETRARRRIGA